MTFHSIRVEFYMTKISFLGPFLTAMTFHSIRVEHYMTKISFLTGFFSVLLRAPKPITQF